MRQQRPRECRNERARCDRPALIETANMRKVILVRYACPEAGEMERHRSRKPRFAGEVVASEIILGRKFTPEGRARPVGTEQSTHLAGLGAVRRRGVKAVTGSEQERRRLGTKDAIQPSLRRRFGYVLLESPRRQLPP